MKHSKHLIVISVIVLFILLLHINYVNKTIYSQFVNVLYKNSIPLIKSEKLDVNRFTILDTRDKIEFKISHIPNSKWIGNTDFKSKIPNDLSFTDTLVVYCSVGYRSEKVAEELKSLGFKNVYNLDGGIISWLNNHNQLIKNGSITNDIHPFSKFWEIWIQRGHILYQ